MKYYHFFSDLMFLVLGGAGLFILLAILHEIENCRKHLKSIRRRVYEND
jgi:hypothetical protein